MSCSVGFSEDCNSVKTFRVSWHGRCQPALERWNKTSTNVFSPSNPSPSAPSCWQTHLYRQPPYWQGAPTLSTAKNPLAPSMLSTWAWNWRDEVIQSQTSCVPWTEMIRLSPPYSKSMMDADPPVSGSPFFILLPRPLMSLRCAKMMPPNQQIKQSMAVAASRA